MVIIKDNVMLNTKHKTLDKLDVSIRRGIGNGLEILYTV